MVQLLFFKHNSWLCSETFLSHKTKAFSAASEDVRGKSYSVCSSSLYFYDGSSLQEQLNLTKCFPYGLVVGLSRQWLRFDSCCKWPLAAIVRKKFNDRLTAVSANSI